MEKITLDTTSISEQLGLYDFFNVLIFGATFIGGVSLLNENVCCFLWYDLNFPKGLGIVVLIYMIGMLLQELGSKIDKHITKIYDGMSQRVLKGETTVSFEKETSNSIIKNPFILEKYRNVAKQSLVQFDFDISDNECFENEFVNGYFFSICQYYVSVKGKDKKIERLRALSSMSITLMSCFFLLAFFALVTLFLDIDMSISVCGNLGFSLHGCEHCIDKLIMFAAFCGTGIAFRFRAKRTMRNFLMILLGTYNAILEEEENSKERVRNIDG